MPIPPDARCAHPGLHSLCAASLRHPACAQRHGLAPWAWATPSQSSVAQLNDNRLVIEQEPNDAVPPRHYRSRRPLRRARPAEGGSCRSVYLAGEALQALGGSRGRRERARVPSTAGSPSRLAERERASPRLWRSRRPLRRPEPAEGGSRRSAAAAVARRCDRPAVRPNLGFGRDGPSENRQDADVSRVFSTARRRRGR